MRVGVQLPVPNFTDSNWHMFQIALPLGRLSLTRSALGPMKERGIRTGVHYPALHLFTLYRGRGFHEGTSRTPKNMARQRSRCRCSRR